MPDEIVTTPVAQTTEAGEQEIDYRVGATNEVAEPATKAKPNSIDKALADVEKKPNAQKAPQNAQKKPANAHTEDEAEEWEYKADDKVIKKKFTKKQIAERLGLAESANQRFQEAARMRREAEGALSKIRNPKDAIKFLTDPKNGYNLEEVKSEFESWYKQAVIARAEMTPEQLELADMRAELESIRAEKAEAEVAREQEQLEKMDAAEIQNLQNEIIGTIEESGMPKTKFTLNRIAYWTRVNEARGINAPRSLVIEQVRHEMREVMDNLVKASDGDTLVKLLGDDTVKKLRKHDLSELRKKRANVGNDFATGEETEKPEPREKTRSSDVNRRLYGMPLGRRRG